MTISLIPESAPFSPEQRAWLNGFLAGWIGLQAQTQLNPAPAAEPEEAFPWHDPNLPIDDRLKLAKGEPLERRLMAAMAQLDCGACGYVCKTYSEAIAAGAEKNLTLCSPGGKETAKTVKRILKERGTNGHAETNGPFKANGHAHANGAAKAATNGHAASNNGYSRSKPFMARLKSSTNLNKAGSAKHTAHVVIDLAGSGLSYHVGDALGVYPTNSPALADSVLAAARWGPEQLVREPGGQELPIRDALLRNFCLRGVSEELMSLLARKTTSGDQRQSLEAALADESYEQFDLLDALALAPSAQINATELVEHLMPLAPRLYSIASSLRAHPDEVHLTIGRVAYQKNGRERLGVASTMFADRTQPGDSVGVFLHRATDFTLPANPAAPMIMVGPGTGVAPFRAFLEERQATAAAGKNWLLFGDQCAATDFLYEEEFAAMQGSRLLTRLDTAFSRDQEHKVYVQDRMRENGAELLRWLEDGAYFFVCGDARRMAVDVDRALHEIVATHGGKNDDQAALYVQDLKRQKRYVRDVY
jgi:sulfite reductase (NADPH) flavoprotein alpha-component